MSSEVESSTAAMGIENASDKPFTHFFDLPQEVRDMIYIYWPKVAWIDITQTHPNVHKADRENDKSVNQPSASKVCRRMRSECLDVFCELPRLSTMV